MGGEVWVFENEPEAGPGRHLRVRSHHRRKGGRKGKHAHNRHNKGNSKISKNRKLSENEEDEDDMDNGFEYASGSIDQKFSHHAFGQHNKRHGRGGSSKKELLKELFVVKKELAINELK